MAETVRIEGLRELEEALSDLKKATARNVLRRVLLKRSQPLADRARELAPSDPSTTRGKLRDRINVSTQLPKGADPGGAAFAAVLRAGGTRDKAVQALRDVRRANPNAFAEVYVGPDRHPKAITQEFGTYFHSPQPYMRPAWDQSKASILDGLSRDLAEEIAKSAARAERRAARQIR